LKEEEQIDDIKKKFEKGAKKTKQKEKRKKEEKRKHDEGKRRNRRTQEKGKAVIGDLA
jgi:hypothetical protein